MHPDVCRFVSETFYDGRLDPIAEVRRSGRRRCGVRDCACCRSSTRATGVESAEEAERDRARDRARSSAATFTDGDGARGRSAPTTSWSSRPTTRRCGCCASALPRRASRSAPSTSSRAARRRSSSTRWRRSSGEDVPRSLDFLFSRNRLNVAISRAQCLAYLVASPRLLEVELRARSSRCGCNALCQFAEMAGGGPRQRGARVSRQSATASPRTPAA